MRILIAALALFCALSASAQTGSASLTWTKPTTNTDGSALVDLAGYRVMWGTSTGSLQYVVAVPDASATAYLVDGLGDGTWYFAVTALNAAGAESAQSNIASKSILASTSLPPIVTSTRIDAAEWTCRDSAGAILSSHTRQDKAQEACTNRALAAPGTVFEIRPSGYRIVAN